MKSQFNRRPNPSILYKGYGRKMKSDQNENPLTWGLL